MTVFILKSENEKEKVTDEKQIVQHETSGVDGVFFIEHEGLRVAGLSYVRESESLIILQHTMVRDVARGTGAGKKMVAYAVQWARKNNVKLNAECSYAAAVLEKNKAWHDVLFNE